MYARGRQPGSRIRMSRMSAGVAKLTEQDGKNVQGHPEGEGNHMRAQLEREQRQLP